MLSYLDTLSHCKNGATHAHFRLIAERLAQIDWSSRKTFKKLNNVRKRIECTPLKKRDQK